MTRPLPPVTRLTPVDLIRLGTVGLHTRPVRTVLAALGISFGIAALILVIGIPSSNQAAVRAQLAALGPNLLSVAPGTDLATGQPAELPSSAMAMIERIGPVQSVAAIGFTAATARRTDLVPTDETGGLLVSATMLNLPSVVHTSLRDGTFLNAATAQYPVAVLGARASTILGIDLRPGRPVPTVWIDDQWFTVVGVLAAAPLAPEVDDSVLVGWPAAVHYLSFDGAPSRIFVRTAVDQVDQTAGVLAATANPERPDEVLVSQPSAVLAAQHVIEHAYSSLFLGLGAVALLVGGLGVANTMIISVLERRREIGLRRALGASRRHIGGQFIAESVILTGIGGLIGTSLGVAITAGYAFIEHWPAVLPAAALFGGAVISVGIGLVAGLYPALRAARLPPMQALSTS